MDTSGTSSGLQTFLQGASLAPEPKLRGCRWRSQEPGSGPDGRPFTPLSLGFLGCVTGSVTAGTPSLRGGRTTSRTSLLRTASGVRRFLRR